MGREGEGGEGRIEDLRCVLTYITYLCEGPPQQKRSLQAGSVVRYRCSSFVFCKLTPFSTFWMRSVCKKNKTCDRLHQYDLERMPHCRFFMSGCLEPACIYQVHPRAVCAQRPAASCRACRATADAYRSTRTTTRTREETAHFTLVASARTAQTAAATTTRKCVLAHLFHALPSPAIHLHSPLSAHAVPRLPRRLLSEGARSVRNVRRFHTYVCNVVALQHVPRATPRL
jgi:hypothetical protein